MRVYLVWLLVFFLWFNATYAQTSAVTETGEEVILYDDGTWKYQNEPYLEEKEIATNPKKFKKDKSTTFLLKSNKVDLGFYLNPKKWSFSKATHNSEAEYELKMKDGDLYGMIISEKFEMPLKTLRNLAVENGRSAAPDLTVVHEEYRNVNGIDVLFLQMDGTTQGLKFSYYGYYYSGEEGIVQFITYTSQNLLETHRGDAEELLNGLVKIEK